MDNRPTEKQISYILAMLNQSHWSAAYRAIGETCGMSPSAAQRRATKQDASRTIEALQSKQ